MQQNVLVKILTLANGDQHFPHFFLSSKVFKSVNSKRRWEISPNFKTDLSFNQKSLSKLNKQMWKCHSVLIGLACQNIVSIPYWQHCQYLTEDTPTNTWQRTLSSDLCQWQSSGLNLPPEKLTVFCSQHPIIHHNKKYIIKASNVCATHPFLASAIHHTNNLI